MHILIVDDNKEVLNMIGLSLEAFEWISVQAEDGEEALRLYDDHHKAIDVILLDHIMPGIEGLDLLPKLLEINSDAVVIMITSYASIPLATEFIKKGGTGFIEKPIMNFEVLKLRIEEAFKLMQQKKELENLRILQRASEALNHSKNTFLANLSHELRTPVATIFPFANLAKQALVEGKGEEAIDFLERLLVGQARLLRFITNIEYLAQIYTKKLALRAKSNDLTKLVQDLLPEVAERYKEKNITWRVSGKKELFVCFDTRALRIALFEIIGNAFKFSSEGGAIEVDITESKEQVQVSIWDEGIGISSDEKETVLHSFVESRLTASQAGGTGLGLAVAKGLAQLHGGGVGIENRNDNKGAVTRLCIPKSKE